MKYCLHTFSLIITIFAIMIYILWITEPRNENVSVYFFILLFPLLIGLNIIYPNLKYRIFDNGIVFPDLADYHFLYGVKTFIFEFETISSIKFFKTKIVITRNEKEYLISLNDLNKFKEFKLALKKVWKDFDENVQEHEQLDSE